MLFFDGSREDSTAHRLSQLEGVFNQGPPAWQRRKKGGGEALGRSRGGLSTKVHAVVDGLGNPLRLLLSPGNRNDICYAQQLLEPFDLRGKYIIADKGLTVTALYTGWRNAGLLS